MQKFVLASAESFGDSDTRGFDLDPQDMEKRVFVVKKGDDFFCFRNSCPHTSAPLNWEGDRFLSLDKNYIQCSLHGALFRIENGSCIAGPCPGTALLTIPISIEDGQLVIEL